MGWQAESDSRPSLFVKTMHLLKVILCATVVAITVPLTASISYANDSTTNRGGMVGVFFLGTVSGYSYIPRFSVVSDANLGNSAMTARPQLSNYNMKSFDGLGIAIDLIGLIGGNFFIDADLSWQYRNDRMNDANNNNMNFDDPHLYNQVISAAVDIGYSSSGKSYVGWTISVGFGVASDTVDGQYPAFADLNVPVTPNSPTSAVNFRYINGSTELFFNDAQYTFYFGQLRLGVEFKPIKSKDSPRMYIGYRGVYSQSIDVQRDEISSVDLEFPTGVAQGITVTTAPIPPNRSLLATDATPPFTPVSKYYIQGQTFRSNIIEIGIKIPMSGA